MPIEAFSNAAVGLFAVAFALWGFRKRTCSPFCGQFSLAHNSVTNVFVPAAGAFAFYVRAVQAFAGRGSAAHWA